MTRTRTLLLGAALAAAPAALAQQHGDHGQTPQTGEMDHSQMDHGATNHGAVDHEALMALHMRMMADPEIHAAMKADPEMQALMAEAMPAMNHGSADHAGMDHEGMNHEMPMNAGDQTGMADRMRERMQALSPADHAAFMGRMESVHLRLLADPAVHERAMADPELRRMMEALPGGMPGMGGADHGAMNGMDHGAMNHDGMDHGATNGAERAAGVALQRRNAGAGNGDERPATPAVGPEAFDASATADRFHAALAAGDRPALEALLTPDAVVLLDGDHYARAEYLGGPLARTAGGAEPLYRRTGVAGDAAWVASTQQLGGAERAELLVLTQTPDGWRVAAVHWSSAQ